TLARPRTRRLQFVVWRRHFKTRSCWYGLLCSCCRSLRSFHDTNCETQQQTRNPARNETDSHKILNQFHVGRRPVCTCHDPEGESDNTVDQDPNHVTIFAEQEKEDDLDDTFGNENDRNYQGEKNHPE